MGIKDNNNEDEGREYYEWFSDYNPDEEYFYQEDTPDRNDIFRRFIYFMGDDIGTIGYVLHHKSGLVDDLECDYIFTNHRTEDTSHIEVDLEEFGNEIPEKVDTLILNHVLEHYADPIVVLDLIKREFLNKKGAIVIAVPHGDFNNAYHPYDDTIGHKSNFICESIRTLANEVNMECEFILDSLIIPGYEELYTVFRKR